MDPSKRLTISRDALLCQDQAITHRYLTPSFVKVVSIRSTMSVDHDAKLV